VGHLVAFGNTEEWLHARSSDAALRGGRAAPVSP